MRYFILALSIFMLASCKQGGPDPEPEPEPTGPDYALLAGVYTAEQTYTEVTITYEVDPANPELGQYDTLVQTTSFMVDVNMLDGLTGQGELTWDIVTASEYYANPMPFTLFDSFMETEHDYAFEDTWKYDYQHDFSIAFPEGTDSLYAHHRYEDLFGAGYAGQGDSLPRLLVRNYSLEAAK